MRTELIIVALATGLGTWLFRFLPTQFRIPTGRGDGWLARLLESVGPAAIATLLIAGLLPALTTPDPQLAALIAGTLTVVVTFVITRGVALPTLLGACAYGLAFALVN